AFVRRLRILRRTSVWPPRAVGVFTSASRQENGVLSNSNNVLRLTLIASISTAIGFLFQYKGGQMRTRLSASPRRRNVFSVKSTGKDLIMPRPEINRRSL